MKARIISMILLVTMPVMLTGCSPFSTLAGASTGQATGFKNVDELESGKAYVWHHPGGDIEDDLSGGCEETVFFTCITGDYNFKNQEMDEITTYPRSIWMDTDTDVNIPTLTASDYLIYVHDDTVPTSFVFERFADYGYTIGVSNLQADLGGHYYFVYSDADEDDYKYFIDMKSDAAVLKELGPIARIYLDRVGDIRVDENSVSDGGTVLGLTKDKTYTCSFYTGTFYQDYSLQANIHSFSSFERFVSYEYEFMHSNFIVIQVPDYFVSGYYFVNGVGLFRYVADADADAYNGEAYDGNIDWNVPMIIYNEDGTVLYDPSETYTDEKEMESSGYGD